MRTWVWGAVYVQLKNPMIEPFNYLKIIDDFDLLSTDLVELEYILWQWSLY